MAACIPSACIRPSQSSTLVLSTGKVISSLALSEEQVATSVVMVLIALALWKTWRRCLSSPLPPDPWDGQLEPVQPADEAHPLCPRCLETHHELEQFCPNCGNPVSVYVSCLPFESVLCVGFVMRVGAAERYRVSRLAVAGFVMTALAYPPFTPFLWYRFATNLAPNRKLDAESRANLSDEAPPPLPGNALDAS